MSRPEELERAAAAFSALAPEAKAAAGRYEGPRLRALYGLSLAKRAAVEPVSAIELSAALEAIDIALSPLQIRNTLAPAAKEGHVSARRSEGSIVYRLTQDGQAELERSSPGALGVLQILGGRPFSGRSSVSSVLREQKGLVRMTDPFYGVRTAELLMEMTGATEVRFLTAQPGNGERPAIARAALKDLMKEVPQLAVRLASSPAGIAHDRYILSRDEFVLIGHGFKDIGNRDSFVVRLPLDVLGGIAQGIAGRFDTVWSAAGPLP